LIAGELIGSNSLT